MSPRRALRRCKICLEEIVVVNVNYISDRVEVFTEYWHMATPGDLNIWTYLYACFGQYIIFEVDLRSKTYEALV